MENKEFTPSESLALITQIIMDAKAKFRENGFSFIYWGTCAFVASFAQFILLQKGYYHINYYPYFLMPIAYIYAFFYYRKRHKANKGTNIISSTLGILGILMGLNMMISGFFFWNKFGIALMPFMLILLAVWLMLSGALIKNRILLVAAIITNIVAFGTFFVAREFHPLIFAIICLIAIVLPGLHLHFSRK